MASKKEILKEEILSALVAAMICLEVGLIITLFG
nr:MAG TPA: hypothetical protein [Caudoviricetes sp.]